MLFPIPQDFVFEPAVFVGGPAEVSYYAQILPLHERFRVEAPHVALRAHVLVANEKVLRAIERYDVGHEELTLPAAEILASREEDVIDALRRDIAVLSAALDTGAGTVRARVVESDPTMARSVDRTLRRIRFHIAKLDERGARAIARRDADRRRAIERLCGTLFPSGIPQDRRIAWLKLWLEHGSELVDRLVELAEPDANVFRIAGV